MSGIGAKPLLRVVVIADFAEPSGGAQAVAIQSSLALARAGVDVTYVQGVAGPVDPRLGDAGIDVVSLQLADVWTLPGGRAALTGVWSLAAARALSAALERLPRGPTILHLHQWTRSLSPAILPVLLSRPARLVITLHEYFIACPNGVYYRFDRSEPCELKPLSVACVTARCDPRSMAHKAVRVARTALMRLAIGSARFDVVHVSDRGHATIGPFLPRQLVQHRIDNPVEAERGVAAAIAPDARIAFIGRLTREKGADLVAAAAERAGLRALFIGDGPAEPDIRAASPGAELLGWRSRNDIARLLTSDVRAVVAPSRWYETGPLTVYEALAAGVPAIVSDRAGAAEKVQDGMSGLVVAPTVDALAAAFRTISEEGVAGRMGAAAHARYWSAPLDPASHAERLQELYDAILSRPAEAALS